MNYEKAWEDLKMYIEILSEMSLRSAESEDMNVDERLRAEGAEIVTRAILDFMDDAEKEMTTVLDDDGQKVQD
ncbi:hypothetical protein K5I04_04800 [Murdochiella sp. Marseille-P8839]|nr:hypothetical protein [Murdochiella sp. Marseille-P8839]